MPSLCQKAALDLQNSCSKLLTAVLGKEKNSCFEKTAVLKIKKNSCFENKKKQLFWKNSCFEKWKMPVQLFWEKEKLFQTLLDPAVQSQTRLNQGWLRLHYVPALWQPPHKRQPTQPSLPMMLRLRSLPTLPQSPHIIIASYKLHTYTYTVQYIYCI